VQEPEGDRMTAASTTAPRRSCCGGSPRAEPVSRRAEAGVLGEGMDERSRGARRGMGPSACTGVAEIMSGRAISQQGLTATCKDPAREAVAEARGGFWPGAWARMSDEGGVTPSERIREVLPAGGSAPGGQRSPGYSAVAARGRRGEMACRPNPSSVWTMSRPGLAIGCCDEEAGKPPPRGVHASQRLSLRAAGQARALTNGVQGRDQNRTREIRPSGIAEGLQETWPLEDILPTARAPDFYLDNRTHGSMRRREAAGAAGRWPKGPPRLPPTLRKRSARSSHRFQRPPLSSSAPRAKAGLLLPAPVGAIPIGALG